MSKNTTKTLIFIKATAVALFLALQLFGPNVASANCVPNSSKQCVSNISYWYDSCGALQSIAQNCNLTNQICRNGTCINKPQPAPNPNPNPNPNPKPTPNTPGQNTTNNQVVVSIFSKKPSDALWQKTLNGTNGERIDFFMTVKNTSNTAIDAVSIQTAVSSDITYSDNLAVDNSTLIGNIGTGINIGSVPAHTSKSILFSGTLQQTANQLLQITAKASTTNNTSDSDSVTITLASTGPTQNPNPGTGTTITPGAAAQQEVVATTGFLGFIEKWYLWIIITIVLSVLFVIIFRRLSSEG